MQKALFIILLFLSNIAVQAQQNFEIATEHLHKKEYALADSFYRLHIQEFPGDQNAKFNYGVAKLYQGDSCTFCNMMQQQCTLNDEEACKLYHANCEKSDTIYYDNKWLLTADTNARYIEITENIKCLNYRVVSIRDKKKKGPHNLIAKYRLLPDSRKLYIYTEMMAFQGFYKTRDDRYKKDEYIDEAKKKLNLSHLSVDVTYIVNESGKIKDIQITNTNKDVENIDELMKYIYLIVHSTPEWRSGSFRGKPVSFVVGTMISFW